MCSSHCDSVFALVPFLWAVGSCRQKCVATNFHSDNYFSFYSIQKSGHTPIIQALQKQRQEDCFMFEGSPIYTIRISSHPGPQIKTLPHKNMPPPNQNKQLNVNHSIFLFICFYLLFFLFFIFQKEPQSQSFSCGGHVASGVSSHHCSNGGEAWPGACKPIG